MVLCYSRMMYVEFTVSQTMEHFLACHQHAFEFFGGIPHKVMVDNLKSAVLHARRWVKRPCSIRSISTLPAHYGFTIAPCNVGKGNEKGRVENGVGYVKKNFLAGLELPDFSALNPAARQWLDTVANVRLHSETREKPVQAMAQRAAVSQSPAAASVRYRHGVAGAEPPGSFALPSRPTATPSRPTTPARRSRSKPIPIGSASTTVTRLLPATPDATIDSKMSKTRSP